MQLPIRSCLFFPFGQASPVPLCRHTLAFPFFAFSTEGEKHEKTYVSGESLLRCHQASTASRVRKASCFPLRAGFACSVAPALPLLSPFFAFPLKEKSAKKPMLAGNPCCVAIRQAQQVECAKPLAFTFGESGARRRERSV